MEKKTVRDMNVKGKSILVRCDFNVPMQDGKIQDDTRINAAIPTIQYLMDQGAKVVLCSHLGKPKPNEMTKEEMKAKYSLNPIAERLSEQLGKEVKFAGDTTGDSAKGMISELKEGDVGLVENTRFDPRETKNDETLSAEFADLADGYVNDAFGSAHRAHSSTEGVARKMEEQGKETALGFLMEKEVEELGAVLESSDKPFVAILGGAKVSDKIGVITNLIENAGVDKILIGGKMANTFLKARGYNIGDSSYEEDKLKTAEEIMKLAVEKGKELILPTDLKVAQIPQDVELTPEVVEQAPSMVVNIEEGIPEGYQSFDIGEQTLDSYANALDGAKKVVWNGPLGYTEAPKYAVGTETVARYIAKQTRAKCVIGGGDSVAAVNKFLDEARDNGEDMSEFDNRFHLSTGGGASLEFLEGKELPGIAVIQNREARMQSQGTTRTVNCKDTKWIQDDTCCKSKE